MDQLRWCETPNMSWQHNNWLARPVMLPKGVQPESPEAMPRIAALTDQLCDSFKEFVRLWVDGPEPKVLMYNWKRIFGNWLERRAMKVGTCDEIKFKIFQDAYKRGIFTNGHVDYFKNQVLLVADDWTYKPMAPKENDPSPLAAAPMNQVREDFWLKNVELNAPLVLKNATELVGTGKGKTAYIVGNGPSLAANGQELLKIKKEKGIIIGTNRLPMYVDPAVLDYIMVIDYSAPAEWAARPMPNTSVVMVPTVSNEYARALNCKERYWFRHPYAGGVNEEMRKRWPELLTLDQGLCCTFSAIHFAYKLGCNKIVFVGQDMSYTSQLRHIGEPLTYDWVVQRKLEGTWTTQKDMHGNASDTDKMFVDMRDHVAGACYFLAKAGIRIINASEHGILYFDQKVQQPDGSLDPCPIFELRRLAEFVAEENGDTPAPAKAPAMNLTAEQIALLEQVRKTIPVETIKQLVGAL